MQVWGEVWVNQNNAVWAWNSAVWAWNHFKNNNNIKSETTWDCFTTSWLFCRQLGFSINGLRSKSCCFGEHEITVQPSKIPISWHQLLASCIESGFRTAPSSAQSLGRGVGKDLALLHGWHFCINTRKTQPIPGEGHQVTLSETFIKQKANGTRIHGDSKDCGTAAYKDTARGWLTHVDLLLVLQSKVIVATVQSLICVLLILQYHLDQRELSG